MTNKDLPAHEQAEIYMVKAAEQSIGVEGCIEIIRLYMSDKENLLYATPEMVCRELISKLSAVNSTLLDKKQEAQKELLNHIEKINKELK